MRLFFRTLTVVMLSFIFVVSGTATALASSVSFTKEAVPAPVIDEGSMFSPEQEKSLAQTIIENHGKYDLFFVIETVPSLNGQKLEEVSLPHANSLKIGEAGKDNGVLIFLSRDDHKIRFELGRGVAAKVNDAVMTAIISSKVTPAFKNANYVEGLTKGMMAVGENYTGTSSSESDSNEGGKLALITVVAICGGLALWLLIMVLHSIFGKEPRRIRKEKKDREDSQARLQALKALVGKFKFSEEIGSYKALHDEKKRFEFLQTKHPYIANILKAHYSSDSPSTILIDRSFYKDAKGFFSDFSGKFDGAVTTYQLMGTGFEGMSIDEANKRICAEEEKYQKIQKQRQKRKEKARAVWNAIPKPIQKALKKAKTQNERLALLSGQVADDFSANYALITSMFLASSSSSSSSSHYGSSSSSSSSSSSYSSSSYDSGSYGGGSFDGGGGSGSW